ncbi:MAG: hypothetical protein HQK97_04605 [Nitrospirae bacterium]|nr:hypothetical protein [Nitrospirota bacterium]
MEGIDLQNFDFDDSFLDQLYGDTDMTDGGGEHQSLEITTPAAADVSQYEAKLREYEQIKEKQESRIRELEEQQKKVTEHALGDWRQRGQFLKTQAPDAHKDVAEMIEAALQSKLSEIEPLKQNVSQIQAATESSRTLQMAAEVSHHLEAMGFKGIDPIKISKDPLFQKFLEKEDPNTGFTYGQIVNSAGKNGRADVTAKHYAMFFKQSKAGARDVNNFIGVKGNGSSDIASPEDTKVYKESLVAQFYSDKVANKFKTPAQKKLMLEIQTKLDKAAKEGRIARGV